MGKDEPALHSVGLAGEYFGVAFVDYPGRDVELGEPSGEHDCLEEGGVEHRRGGGGSAIGVSEVAVQL